MLKNRVIGTNKKNDKIDELFEGPYEVVEAGEFGVDYKIRRIGTKKKPEWRHVDDIKAYEEDELVRCQQSMFAKKWSGAVCTQYSELSVIILG